MFTKCQNKERKRGWNCQRASILIRICFSKRYRLFETIFNFIFLQLEMKKLWKDTKQRISPIGGHYRERKNIVDVPLRKIFFKNIFCPKFWKSKSRVVEIFWICWTLLLHFFEYSKIGNAPKSSPEKSQFSQPFNIFLRKWRHTWTPIEWSSVTNLLGFVKLTRE